MFVSLITRMMKHSAAVMVAFALSAPLAAAAATSAYVIHPNDQLNVQVFGDASLSQTVTVLPSGDINYPLVGSIHVAGQSPARMRQVSSPSLSVSISR